MNGHSLKAPVETTLLPLPMRCHHPPGPGVRIDADTAIIAMPGARPEAQLLAELLARIFGRTPVVRDATERGDSVAIRLSRSDLPDLGDEGYALVVGDDGIDLRAAAPAGLGNGAHALVQLLPASAPQGALVAAIDITDRPRFGWRGAMLDPARNFLSVEDLMRFIDLLARHRLNRLHLHLTDDQGWRIEIKRYPRLTQVGAWRAETVERHSLLKPRLFNGHPHGGFYTRDDIERIVAYGTTRHVTIVPEIDLPGHMQAAIAAYPWLGNDGLPCAVSTYWGVHSHVLNAEERTMRFLEDVLTEVIEMFPSPWIHIGGDEAVKDEWKASPRIQERIRELAVGDEHGLQSHIIKRMDAFLTSRGRRLLGWDEILEGGLSPNATVMAWRGFTGGIEAAASGHDVIMAVNSHTYFDFYQHPDKVSQPLAIGGMLPLEKVYAHDPLPPELTQDQAAHVLGGQGQLWGEYIADRDHLDYMAFPRLCALAEVLWSPKEARDWSGFEKRLAIHKLRLDALGVRYFREPDPAAVPVRPREIDRPALIVLAAGMGSRFGGDKEVARVGRHQETLLDFTIFDALRSGFVETILVVRPENQALVHELVGQRIARHMPVRYALQSIAEPIPGLPTSPTRSKPWGTAHALACALRGLQRPCGVVNADDWYSPSGIRALAQLLGRCDATAALVTYPLSRTLSTNGPVNRAICTTNSWSRLTSIEETTGILPGPQGPEVRTANGQVTRQIAADTQVSLNLWGFQPNFYAPFIADVEEFIRANRGSPDLECMLPLLAMAAYERHGAETRCDLVQADWAGLTYQADRAMVQARLEVATAAGEYPSPLWG